MIIIYAKSYMQKMQKLYAKAICKNDDDLEN